jgi:hypothetical protein
MIDGNGKFSMRGRPGLEAYINGKGYVVLHQDDSLGGEEAYICLELDQVGAMIEWLEALATELMELDDGQEE